MMYLIGILAILAGALVFSGILYLNRLDNRRGMAIQLKVASEYQSRTLGDPGSLGRRY